jgi:hypothetical protein
MKQSVDHVDDDWRVPRRSSPYTDCQPSQFTGLFAGDYVGFGFVQPSQVGLVSWFRRKTEPFRRHHWYYWMDNIVIVFDKHFRSPVGG